MENLLLSHIKEQSKYWWTSLIVGITAIILGIWFLVTPLTALIAMTYFFVAGFLISGAFDITFAVSNRKILPGWGWTFAGGIIDVLFGLMLVALPVAVTTSLFVYFIGFWILFRSIWAIGISAELNNYMNAGALLVLSILSLLFAIFYLFSPAFGGLTIVALAAIAFITYGSFRVYYAFRLKAINKKIKE